MGRSGHGMQSCSTSTTGPTFSSMLTTRRSTPRQVSARRTHSWLSVALSRSGAKALHRSCAPPYRESRPARTNTSAKSFVVSAASNMRSIRCPGRRSLFAALGKNVPMTQQTDATEHRIERDTMGEVKVPAKALWKAQTQRAVENFPISGIPINSELIAALGLIKEAAAKTNAKLAVLSEDYAGAIANAASEVAANQHDGEFPLDVFQTGSGTSSNMNANEGIASLAAAELGKSVHPNDHVNASQSSNDVFPSAIHIAATYHLVYTLLPALRHLEAALSQKAAEFAEIVKSGRTHLMDATPVTLGQEFGGYSAQIRYGIERVDSALPRVAELALGGTAVGTGINTPPGFAESVINMVADKTGLPLTEARNHFEAQGAQDALVEVSGVLRTIAVSLYKIANDVRWMGSGPRAGLGEIALPDLQPGSSI